MATLEAKNIAFSYPENLSVLNDVSLALKTGERVAIMGENSSGKTTLSFLLAGAIKPHSGDIFLDGLSAWSDIRKYRCRIGYVFQNPEDGFIASDIRREIAFSAENHAIPANELRRRVQELFERFELDKFSSHSPLELCGGMKARLAITSAFATEADFIILDEPETFLDARGKSIFENTIKQISLHSGILHITQSERFAHGCDRIFVIDRGTLRTATVDDFQPIAFSKFALPPPGEMVLKINNVSFRYDNLNVLENISFCIGRGEIVGLVGASGSGKTTLALICSGILSPMNGKVERKGKVSVSLQFPERQLFAETVLDDVLFAPKNSNIMNPKAAAIEALSLMEIDEKLWEVSPFLLSDGMQRRVALAAVIAAKPDVLILDEPFASLDRRGIVNLINVIEKLAKYGVAIILITHRTDLLVNIASRTVALQSGKILFDGDTRTLLHNSILCEKCGIVAV